MKNELAWLFYRIAKKLEDRFLFYFPTNPGMIFRNVKCMVCKHKFKEMPMAISVEYKGKTGLMCPNDYAKFILRKKKGVKK